MKLTRNLEPRRDRTALPGAAGAALLVALAPSLAAASEGGLVLIPNPWLTLSLIALFLLLIAPANALVFKPLLRVLDERDARISGNRPIEEFDKVLKPLVEKLPKK